MIKRTLQEFADLSGGELIGASDPTLAISGVTIDTRTMDPGSIYMPIIGEKLDGHIFYNDAIDHGAVASFWNSSHSLPERRVPLILVEDTTAAYQRLAKNYRAQLGVKVIGITGSNGKTTTKDILSSVLDQRYRVTKTIGNLNNHIGAPKTLLTLDDNTDVAVVEMGTEDFGEIRLLTDIAKPDIAIITNIGDVHLEKLGSRDNIAIAKLEILEGLAEEGVFIYNGDDETLRKAVAQREIPQRVITFGVEPDNDYVIEEMSSDSTGNTFKIDGVVYKVPLLGNHQKYNGAVAVIIAELFGLSVKDIHEGLEEIDSTGMRNELICCQGFDILNDSYKSNPQSLTLAMDTLYMLSGYRRKIAIVGDMLGLGEHQAKLHREIGEQIDPDQIDYLLLYGPLTKHMELGALKNFPRDRVIHYDRKTELIDRAKNLIEKSTIVMVKASRALRMEEIIEGLVELKV